MSETDIKQVKSQDVFALPMNLFMQTEEGRQILAQIDELLPTILAEETEDGREITR